MDFQNTAKVDFQHTAKTERRNDVLGFTLAGAVLLLAGAALPWWHTINAPEPIPIRACRLFSALLAGSAVAALLRPRRRVALLIGTGGLGTALPLLALLAICLIDSRSLYAAVNQTNQAANLITEIGNADINPQIPWTEERKLRSVPIIANDFTLADALETASYYAKFGMYACLLGSLLVGIAAWMEDAPAARRWLVQRRGVLAALALALGLVYFTRPAVSYYFWNRARAAELANDCRAALRDYRRALAWDGRLDYDVEMHRDLGRLYARLGLTAEPDYWANVGDIYASNGNAVTAYQIYRRHIADVDANPTLRLRYANVLFVNGLLDYNTGLFASAVTKWERAIRMEPTNLQIMTLLAMGYSKIGSYPDAILWWKTLIRANESVGIFQTKFFSAMTYRKPITARAWSGLSWCYFRVHDFRRAEKCRFFATQIGASSLRSVE